MLSKSHIFQLRDKILLFKLYEKVEEINFCGEISLIVKFLQKEVVQDWISIRRELDI